MERMPISRHNARGMRKYPWENGSLVTTPTASFFREGFPRSLRPRGRLCVPLSPTSVTHATGPAGASRSALSCAWSGAPAPRAQRGRDASPGDRRGRVQQPTSGRHGRERRRQAMAWAPLRQHARSPIRLCGRKPLSIGDATGARHILEIARCNVARFYGRIALDAHPRRLGTLAMVRTGRHSSRSLRRATYPQLLHHSMGHDRNH
jgi:hypothetical protein